MVGAGAGGAAGAVGGSVAVGGLGTDGAGGGAIGIVGFGAAGAGGAPVGEAAGASAAFRVTRTVSFFKGTLEVCLDGCS